jgi:hypothetical protein
MAQAFRPAARFSARSLALIARNKRKVAAAVVFISICAASYSFWPSRGIAHHLGANSSAAHPARAPEHDDGLPPLPPLVEELLREVSQEARSEGDAGRNGGRRQAPKKARPARAPERDDALAPLPPFVEQLLREAARK